MKTAMIILITSITALLNTLAFADSHATSSNAVDGPCPEFNNNQYMKWIDLDASCKTRQQFISDIESEGLWDITNDEYSEAINLTKKTDPKETAEIIFGSLWNPLGVSTMTINKKINCEAALHQLEAIGFPDFPKDYYEVGQIWNIYLPTVIGSTGFMIGGAAPSETCEFMEFVSM